MSALHLLSFREIRRALELRDTDAALQLLDDVERLRDAPAREVRAALGVITKSGVDLDNRLIRGRASSFEPPERHDAYGSVFELGAFGDFVTRFKDGEPLPFEEMHGFAGSQAGVRGRVDELDECLEGTDEEKGLWMVAYVSETQAGNDVLQYAADRAYTGLSISFVAREYAWSDVHTRWGWPVRVVLRADLDEISIVDRPANPFARINEVRMVRALEFERDVRRQLSGDTSGPRISAQALSKAREMGERLDALIRAIPRETRSRGCDCGKRSTTRRRRTRNAPPKREVRGAALGALLDELIESQTNDDTERSDVIAELADEAGISEGTVNDIINGAIDCPPLERLEAFAAVLMVSVDELISAAEDDGCDYSDDDDTEEDDSDLSVPRRRRRGRRLPTQPLTSPRALDAAKTQGASLDRLLARLPDPSP